MGEVIVSPPHQVYLAGGRGRRNENTSCEQVTSGYVKLGFFVFVLYGMYTHYDGSPKSIA